MIKFQLSQALTSHFKSFWSILHRVEKPKITHFLSFQGCQKQFPTITSLLVHHSVMPEMLPCPLLLNRYNNPAFNDTSDEPLGDLNDEDDNYLDPERDYELIHSLRQCIMKKDPEEISVIIEDFQQQNIH